MAKKRKERRQNEAGDKHHRKRIIGSGKCARRFGAIREPAGAAEGGPAPCEPGEWRDETRSDRRLQQNQRQSPLKSTSIRSAV